MKQFELKEIQIGVEPKEEISKIPKEYLSWYFIKKRVTAKELHTIDFEPYYMVKIGGKLFQTKEANYGTNNSGFKTREEAIESGKKMLQRFFEASKLLEK